MSSAPNTKSTLTEINGQNKTSTALSTNIIIMVGNTPVGAVQSLQIKEDRAIKMIDEVGTDGHIDSAPHASTNITGSCSRVRFDGMRIAEAFSRGFVHAASQAYPFDIIIMDKQRGDTNSQVTTVIKNVWITSIDVTYQQSDWVITENMSWQAERISSHISAGNTAATGGTRQISHMNLAVEQNADTGKNGQGGSLDAAGLIDLTNSGTFF